MKSVKCKSAYIACDFCKKRFPKKQFSMVNIGGFIKGRACPECIARFRFLDYYIKNIGDFL
jgi:hypothetical protein